MIKMTIYNYPNATTPDGILIQLFTEVPTLGPSMLFFVWVMVFLGGLVRQNLRNTYADAPQWAVLASLSTLLLSLVLTVISGYINLPTLVVVISVTVLSGIWFFMTRGRFE